MRGISRVLVPLVAVAVAGAIAAPAHAERINVTFAGAFDQGALSGDLFDGSFWYDSDFQAGGDSTEHVGVIQDFVFNTAAFNISSISGSNVRVYPTSDTGYFGPSGGPGFDEIQFLTGATGIASLSFDLRLPPTLATHDLPTALPDLSGAISTNVAFSPLSGGASYGSLSSFTLTRPDATAAVPEPGTWATMLAGFGLVGMAARRRQRAQFANA